MSFPSNNVKRRNRRKLGRNQLPPVPIVTCTATPSASTVTLTFSGPVVVTANVDLTVAGLTFVSQSITSPTVLVVTMSGTVATKAWTFKNANHAVGTYQGGTVAAAAGTFP